MKLNTWTVCIGAGAAALAAGLVLPPEAYLGIVAALFLLAAGAIVFLVQLRKPFLGLAALVATAVAFPIEFPGPSAGMVSTSLPLAASFCGVWLFQLVAVRRSLPVDKSRVMYAAVAFVTVTLLSFGFGQFPWFVSGGAPLPAQVAELALFLVSVCLFLAVGHQVDSEEQLKWLTWLFVAAGTVTCVMQVLPGLTSVARWTTRPGSVGSLFWTWLVAVSLAQALFNRSLAWPARLFLLGVNVIVFYHGLVQVRSWASGWVPPLAALGIIFLVRLPRFSLGSALVAFPVGLFVASVISTVLLGDEAYSLMTRQEAWATLWTLVERSPFLGTGPANYYYFTENLNILGWYVRFISHNNYQDLLVQTGVLGLLAFFWLAFEIFRMALRVHRRVSSDFAKAYVIGAVGGLTGSLFAGLLGDWIIPFYYNAGILGFRSSLLFWVFLGGVLSLKRLTLVQALADAREREDSTAFASGRGELLGAH